MAEGYSDKKPSADNIVIPSGNVASRLVIELAAALSEIFLCRAKPGERMQLYLGTWNPGRWQYLTSPILDAIQRSKPAGVPLLLGVSAGDFLCHHKALMSISALRFSPLVRYLECL